MKWKEKFIYFTAQHKCARSAVSHLQYMYFKIQLILFKHGNLLNPKAFFQGGLSKEWVAEKDVREGMFEH